VATFTGGSPAKDSGTATRSGSNKTVCKPIWARALEMPIKVGAIEEMVNARVNGQFIWLRKSERRNFRSELPEA
jgi:hypothetical protein